MWLHVENRIFWVLKLHVRLPSFSSKRGHVTEKHVLNGCKRDKLGNQTFEVLQLLKRTVFTIPFTYFTWLSHSRHLNHLISEILERGIPGLKFRQYLCIENISTNSKAFQLWRESLLTAVELQMFGYQACHGCAQLEHVFSDTCPRLDENDGKLRIMSHKSTHNVCKM